MKFIPATCPATIFVTLPCPDRAGQGRFSMPCRALDKSSRLVNELVSSDVGTC
jgi:hypothetical protein